jgi:hypothetical protein
MLTVRLARGDSRGLQALAPPIARAVHAHPLAPHMDALVLIGVGDPLLMQQGDPASKVMVPLVGSARPDALSRDQMRAMDALVLLDPCEWPGRAGTAPDPVIVIPGSPEASDRMFLRGCSGVDALEAADALRAMPALGAAVRRARPRADEPPVSASDIADAVMEAIVATRGAQ